MRAIASRPRLMTALLVGLALLAVLVAFTVSRGGASGDIETPVSDAADGQLGSEDVVAVAASAATATDPSADASPGPSTEPSADPSESPSTPPAATPAAPALAPPATTSPAPPPPVAPAQAAGGTRNGMATFYGAARPGGACMTQTVPASRYTVAISHEDWAGSSHCQAYVEVTGARGTILAKVDNLCPDPVCVSGHLDMSDEAFAAVDDPQKGYVPITWRFVKNPPVEGDIVVTPKDGSNQWWLGLHIDNTGNAIATVDVTGAGRETRTAARSNSGFFVAEDAGPGPFEVRITDVHGQQVTLTGITLDVGKQQRTGQRLY